MNRSMRVLATTAMAAAFSAAALAVPSAASAAVAPSCFHTNYSAGIFSTTVYYNNTCNSAQKVKLIMLYGTDSNCRTVARKTKGSFKSTSTGGTPRLEEVRLC